MTHIVETDNALNTTTASPESIVANLLPVNSAVAIEVHKLK